MLDHALPDAGRFRLSRNEFRALGIGMRAYVRRDGLASAFNTRRDLRASLDTGEIWVMESDEIRAASSFVSLLRFAGSPIPARFDGVTPPLPRHDYGLILNFDSSRTRPWTLEYYAEQRNDRVVLSAMTFLAVLKRSLALTYERALSAAHSVSAMEDQRDATAVTH